METRRSRKPNEPSSSRRGKGKRKAGSSSNPMFDEQFVCMEARTWFEENSGRTVIPERGIDFNGFDLPIFRARHWDMAALQPEKAARTHVREFYANAQFAEPGYIAYVRGRQICYSSAEINSFLNIPDVEDQVHIVENDFARFSDEILATLCVEGSNWEFRQGGSVGLQQSMFNVKSKAIHKFVIAKMIPSTNSSEVIYERACLNFCIQRPEFQVNYGYHVNKSIVHALQPGCKSGLVCPHLLTELFVNAGVEIDGGSRLLRPKPFLVHDANFGRVRREVLVPPVGNAPNNDDVEEEIPAWAGNFNVRLGTMEANQRTMQRTQDMMMQRFDGVNWMLERFAHQLHINIDDRPQWPHYPPPPPQDDLD